MGGRALSALFRKQAVEGKIRNLVKDLSLCAPAPGVQLSGAGAAYISLSSAFAPASHYEGMMGAVAVDGFVSAALSDNIGANDNALFTMAAYAGEEYVELVDEYYADRRKHDEDKTHNNFGHGRGSVALYERPRIKNIFNFPAIGLAPEAIEEKQRRNLESAIANLLKQRSALHYQANHAAPDPQRLPEPPTLAA